MKYVHIIPGSHCERS